MDTSSFHSTSTHPTRTLASSEVSSDFSFKSSESNIRLEEHIKLHHLQKLLQHFQNHAPVLMGQHDNSQGVPLQKDKDAMAVSAPQKPGMMTLAEFKMIISAMLGTTRWDDQMEMLFYKVDTGCDGYVDWNEFCTYMLLQMRELEHIQNMKLIPFTSETIVKRSYHNKQETTTRMLLVENPTRIVNISKVGVIGVWDSELRLLKTYKLAGNVAPDENGAKRRFHTWVTDAVYMRNAQKFALTTTSREIYFFDTSTATYYVEFCLYALPDVPTCVSYWFAEGARDSHSILLCGDDTGSVHIMHFHHPQSRLFEKPFSPQQGMQRIYFNDLRDHRKFVTHQCISSVHQDVIRRVMYVPDGDVIISSSVSSSTSVVLMDMKRKKKSYVYKVNKGVECFDYSKALNILVTGSLDHVVRLWNPYVEAKPICLLQGHSTGICDVVINRSFVQVISYSKDAVIRVWDIKEHNCIQTITLKIPSVQPGRIPDHGEFPLSLFEAPHNLLLVSCNDCVALLKMGKMEPPPEAPTTHKAPLCNAIYNSLFHQVVTGADDSTVTVWNIEDGRRSLKFSEAHGSEEITCISFDKTHRRLFTGARDGTIKAWNFQNGNCLHEYDSVADAEVTGVMSFQDKKILAVGWSRVITLYDDSDPDIVSVGGSTDWKAGQLHQDDILTLDHCEPSYLATGSYDGTIIVWNEETQQVTTTLRSKDKGGLRAPVEKLLFLQDRIMKKMTNGAVLLSSEGGIIHAWRIFGHQKHVGYFSAVESNDTSVLGLASSPDNSLLVTADTDGFVTVWDISEYCIDDEPKVETRAPTMKHRWKAHDRAIANIEYVDYELMTLLVTSSSDKTARLWTLDGKYIGTFGQQKKWDLKRPATFQHPKNPWGEIDETSTLVEEFESNSEMQGNAEELETANPEEPHVLPALDAIDETEEVEEDDVISESDLGKDTKEPDQTMTVELGENAGDFVTNLKAPEVKTRLTSPLGATNRHAQRRMTSHADTTSQSRDVERSRLRWRESKSMTVSEFEMPKEKILGERAEKNLAKRTVTRQERRYRVGYVNRTTTSRFGNLCSPFQALSIPDTSAIDFSSRLPMSRRMEEKGMACTSEKDLDRLQLQHLLELGDSDGASAVKEKTRKLHSSRKRFGGKSPRRNNLLPPLSSRASSVASMRTIDESRPSSAACPS